MDTPIDVLIVAEPDDPHSEAVSTFLRCEGGSSLRYNLRDLRTEAMEAGGGTLRLGLGNHKYAVSRRTTVWWRRVGVVETADLSDEEARLAIDEGPHLLIGTLAAAGVRFVDNPSKVDWAEFKLVQLSVARELGIATPATSSRMMFVLLEDSQWTM
jgi:hypothetical protein